jgi:hypothetical protein
MKIDKAETMKKEKWKDKRKKEMEEIMKRKDCHELKGVFLSKIPPVVTYLNVVTS